VQSFKIRPNSAFHVSYNLQARGTYVKFPGVENLERNVYRSGEGVAADVDDAVSLIGTERIEDLRQRAVI